MTEIVILLAIVTGLPLLGLVVLIGCAMFWDWLDR